MGRLDSTVAVFITNDEVIIELLREIRDLQRAHHERYLHFTQTILDNNEKASRQIEQDTSRAITANRRANWTHIYTIMVIVIALSLFFLFRRS